MKRYIRSTEYSASDLEPEEDYEYEQYAPKRKTDAELKQEINEMLDSIDFTQVPIDLRAGLADPHELSLQIHNYLRNIVKYYNTWYAIVFPDGKRAFYSDNRAGTVTMQFLNGNRISITKKNVHTAKRWFSVFDKHKFLEIYIHDKR